MTSAGFYKDRPAIRVDTGALAALFLPEDGGKLASLKARDGYEYLYQGPESRYRRLTVDGSYIEAECSGWDDMFPTIDPYQPEGLPPYPDHGEICRIPLEHIHGADSDLLRADSRLFPVSFSKEIRALKDGGLSLRYTLRNDGREPFPCLWAAHCMLRAEDEAEILTPYAPDAPIRLMFGPDGQSRHRLSNDPGNDSAYKYYYTDPIPEGWCGCRYPGRKETLLLRYDPREIPWLAVWLNNGEFKGIRNIALEPCTAPYDRPDAAAPGERQLLPPGSETTFTLCIHIIKED